MRAEKQYLVDEVGRWIDKSGHLFLAGYTGLTVADAAELRAALRPLGAEFHVVKNNILTVAGKSRGLPDLGAALTGQNGIIVGGTDAAAIAKTITNWFKDKNKGEVKGGILDKKALNAADVKMLSDLPPLPNLQAQFLALLNTPSTSLVRILNAVPQSLVNVLDAKVRKEGGAA